MSVVEYLVTGKSDKKPKAESLFAELRSDILTGTISNGSKLTEKDICEKYNVSRTPVREALTQLEMIGLIENIPNRGAFVRSFSKNDLRDILILRKNAEIQCAKWAALRITEHEENELEETFEFMKFYTMKNDINRMININSGFHQIIYNACHNRIMVAQLQGYQAYINACCPSNCFEANYLEKVFNEHKTIYNAIRNHDDFAAELAMTKHMTNAIERKIKFNF